MVRKPLRVWWPWSWVLLVERWLLAPVAVAVALALASAIRPPVALVAVVALAVAVRSWWVCQSHRATVAGRGIPTVALALVALALALAWLAWSGSGRALALGTTVAVVARGWHDHHHRATRTRAVARVWAVALGCPGGRLGGSLVEDVRFGSGGLRSLYVVLPPGQLSLADVQRAKGHIATAYATTTAQVRVERGDDDSRPVVHIAPPGVLHRVHAWPGDPVAPDGTAVVGVLDDERPAVVRLWSDVGSKIVWLVGKRGSGKSRAVHLLLAGAARSGLVALDLVDMKGGVDLSRWGAHTVTGQVACDLEGARAALARANRVHDARMDWLRATGTEKFTIGAHGPLWLVALEEAHEALVDPECARAMGRLGRLSRATGVGALLVTQVAKVEALGGREVLGNVDLRVVFECDRSTAQRAVDGLSPVDLTAMPVGSPGVALWIGEGCDSGQLGRWFDVDPSTVTDGALAPVLDEAARTALGLRLVSCAPAAEPAVAPAAVRAEPREAVAAFLAEHPGASSGQVEAGTGVPARTVRYWRARETGPPREEEE